MARKPQVLPCETPGCPEPAACIAQRIDASTDRFYGCEPHARAWTAERAAECAPLPPLRPRELPSASLPLVLAWWPPRHRRITQQAARRIAARY